MTGPTSTMVSTNSKIQPSVKKLSLSDNRHSISPKKNSVLTPSNGKKPATGQYKPSKKLPKPDSLPFIANQELDFQDLKPQSYLKPSQQVVYPPPPISPSTTCVLGSLTNSDPNNKKPNISLD